MRLSLCLQIVVPRLSSHPYPLISCYASNNSIYFKLAEHQGLARLQERGLTRCGIEIWDGKGIQWRVFALVCLLLWSLQDQRNTKKSLFTFHRITSKAITVMRMQSCLLFTGYDKLSSLAHQEQICKGFLLPLIFCRTIFTTLRFMKLRRT